MTTCFRFRAVLAAFAIGALGASLLSSSLGAQGACSCAAALPFGSCAIKSGNYPDSFPGAVAVVPRTGGPPYVYAADLYNGFTYRYLASTLGSTEKKITSPRGSNETTGLAFRLNGTAEELYWAIENQIIRTDLLGANSMLLGTVDLPRLADLIRALPESELRGQTEESVRGMQAGTLGGITWHEGRQVFWGVDIVNDLYFEFKETGELSLADGKPIFFWNPKRNPITGGAYGNSLTYVKTPTAEYFDLPIGAIADQRPSEVHRVHAADTAGPPARRIGDGTGIFYALGANVGTPKFVTGIAYWADSCAAGQASEMLLDLDTVGGTPKVIEITADPPTTASVADFRCVEADTAEVTLTWKKTLPYTSFQITRRPASGSSAPVAVFTHTDFATDPETFTDRGLFDGTYEYSAEVTANPPVAPVKCTATTGLGSVVASRRFIGSPGSPNPTPFAVTVAKAETVIVAELESRGAETFGLDLVPKGFLDSPFDTGLTTGVSYSATDDALFWLQNQNGQHFLRKTDLAGQPAGDALRVQWPANLSNIELGDIAHDPALNFFWTADLLSNQLYGITPSGAVADPFKTVQVQVPEAGKILGGGVGVSAAAADKVTLDIPLGEPTTGMITHVGSYEYTRANLAAPPRLVQRVDLTNTTGASNVGGIASVTEGDTRFLYVAALDTRSVYKLQFTRTPGLDPFRRGDVNNDGALNISDPSFLLANLFKGGTAPACQRAADVDDSGAVNIGDAIQLFNYLFRSGAPPQPPFASCGVDSESALPCPTSICVTQ
jgi:hypothetical protein